MTIAETALGSDAERRARAFARRDFGAGLVVENPATEEPLAEVALSGPADVDAAVAAAHDAFDDARWSGRDPAEQEAVLRRLATLVGEHAEELAWLETLDNGKPLAEARAATSRGAVAVFALLRGLADEAQGDVHATDRRFLA